MKIKIICSITMLALLGCADESATSTIDFKQYAGIWVPYEMTLESGTILTGPFTNSTIFGVYAESVQLNDDKTYVPLIWKDKDNYSIKTDDAGHFEYTPGENKLSFKGDPLELEFEIIKYNNDDLWLKYIDDLSINGGPQSQYKLKRELK